MENIDKESFKKKPVTVGLMLWMFGSIVGVVIAVGGYVLSDLKADISKGEEARKEWVKEEFKPHVIKYDEHVQKYNETDKVVAIVVDRTNSMADKTSSIGTHNIETIRPDD